MDTGVCSAATAFCSLGAASWALDAGRFDAGGTGFGFGDDAFAGFAALAAGARAAEAEAADEST